MDNRMTAGKDGQRAEGRMPAAFGRPSGWPAAEGTAAGGSGSRDGVWLALDTSTAAMTAALAREGRAFAKRDSLSERNHSIRLLPEVESLLAEAGLAPHGLAAIAVGRGPGSYTGIRIGVTVAKMMAWSLQLPLYAVSSLEALAYGAVLRGTAAADGGPVWIVPLMDARRGKAYTGLYAYGPDGWRALEADGIRPMEEWLAQLAERLEAEQMEGRGPWAEERPPGATGDERSGGDGRSGGDDRPGGGERSAGAGRLLFVGDHAGFRDLLDDFAGRANASVRTDDAPLSAAAVAALAWMHGGRCRVDDPHNLFPNYTQLSEPEKKLAARHAALKP